jgi:uncharacterized membrane protein YphA (DoxX/SURF4 family)
MFIATVVLAALLALAFLGAGASKLAGAKNAVDTAARLDVAFSSYRLIGAAEVLGAAGVVAGLWVPALGIAASVGLILLMIGAVIFHTRAKDKAAAAGPAVVLALVAIAYLVLVVGAV